MTFAKGLRGRSCLMKAVRCIQVDYSRSCDGIVLLLDWHSSNQFWLCGLAELFKNMWLVTESTIYNHTISVYCLRMPMVNCEGQCMHCVCTRRASTLNLLFLLRHDRGCGRTAGCYTRIWLADEVVEGQDVCKASSHIQFLL